MFFSSNAAPFLFKDAFGEFGQRVPFLIHQCTVFISKMHLAYAVLHTSDIDLLYMMRSQVRFPSDDTSMQII